MVKLSAVKVSVDAVENGVWEPIMKVGDSELRMKIRSTKSKVFQAELSRLAKEKLDLINELKDKKDRGQALENLEFDMQREIAWCLVADWSGLEEDDGTPIPFSVERCREIITDPDALVVRDRVIRIADSMEAFRNRVMLDFPGEPAGAHPEGSEVPLQVAADLGQEDSVGQG